MSYGDVVMVVLDGFDVVVSSVGVLVVVFEVFDWCLVGV